MRKEHAYTLLRITKKKLHFLVFNIAVNFITPFINTMIRIYIGK